MIFDFKIAVMLGINLFCIFLNYYEVIKSVVTTKKLKAKEPYNVTEAGIIWYENCMWLIPLNLMVTLLNFVYIGYNLMLN